MTSTPTQNPLSQIDAALRKECLPGAKELIGRKFCFSSDGTGELAGRIIVGTIVATVLEEEFLYLIPQAPPDPVYQLVAFQWAIQMEPGCNALYCTLNINGNRSYSYLPGIFELID